MDSAPVKDEVSRQNSRAINTLGMISSILGGLSVLLIVLPAGWSGYLVFWFSLGFSVCGLVLGALTLRTSWGKLGLAISALMCLVLIGLIWIGWSAFPSNPVLEPTDKLQASDLKAIEEVIGLSLPNIDAVKKIALLHGKDSVPFFELRVSQENAAGLMEVLKKRAKPLEASELYGFDDFTEVKWFHPPVGGHFKGGFDFESGIMKYAFYDLEDGNVEVLIVGGKEPFSAAFYGIFSSGNGRTGR